MLEEKNLSAARLLSLVKDLINEPARLRSLAENSLKIGRRQAAPYIVAK